MISVTKEFTFDSAHYLENYVGPCANMHGHTYKLQITVSGQIGTAGMVVDFNLLKEFVTSNAISRFDHKVINQVVDYNPTAENMVQDIAGRLIEALPDHIRLGKVRLWETPTSFATWSPKQ